MAVHHRDIRVENGSGPRVGAPYTEEPGLGELFRQLSADATHLIRQEVALGKAELRETGAALAKDAVKVGIAIGLGALGAMAATAFLIVAIGSLLANYWLSALLVAVIYLGIAAVLAKRAMDDIKHRDLKPTQTIETLRNDADWAKQEARTIKREWTT
jgi:uncharacterized membrane protein YqjE